MHMPPGMSDVENSIGESEADRGIFAISRRYFLVQRDMDSFLNSQPYRYINRITNRRQEQIEKGNMHRDGKHQRLPRAHKLSIIYVAQEKFPSLSLFPIYSVNQKPGVLLIIHELLGGCNILKPTIIYCLASASNSHPHRCLLEGMLSLHERMHASHLAHC